MISWLSLRYWSDKSSNVMSGELHCIRSFIAIRICPNTYQFQIKTTFNVVSKRNVCHWKRNVSFSEVQIESEFPFINGMWKNIPNLNTNWYWSRAATVFEGLKHHWSIFGTGCDVYKSVFQMTLISWKDRQCLRVVLQIPCHLIVCILLHICQI